MNSSAPPRPPPQQHSNGVSSVHNRTSHHHAAASSGPPPHGHGGPAAGNDNGSAGAGGENNSGLGLWNFGGFGDDAKNRSAAPQARGGMLDDSNVNLDFMGDHANKVSIYVHFFISI